MWKQIDKILDRWSEKHLQFVGMLLVGIILGLMNTYKITYFSILTVIGIVLSVALLVMLYKWIAELVEKITTMDKKLDEVIERLSLRCTNTPPHTHPPWNVTYSKYNLDDGSGWGAHAYHCVELPCRSHQRAGEKREWITESVEVAERDGFAPCKICFKARNL